MAIDVTITPPGETPPAESPELTPPAPAPTPPPEPTGPKVLVRTQEGLEIVEEELPGPAQGTEPPPAAPTAVPPGAVPPTWPNPFEGFAPPPPTALPQPPPAPPEIDMDDRLDPARFAQDAARELERVSEAKANKVLARFVHQQNVQAAQTKVLADLRSGSVHFQRTVAADPSAAHPAVKAHLEVLVREAQLNALNGGPAMSDAFNNPRFHKMLLEEAKNRAGFQPQVSVARPGTRVLSSSGGQGQPSPGGGELSADEDRARQEFGLTVEQWNANKKTQRG